MKEGWKWKNVFRRKIWKPKLNSIFVRFVLLFRQSFGGAQNRKKKKNNESRKWIPKKNQFSFSGLVRFLWNFLNPSIFFSYKKKRKFNIFRSEKIEFFFFWHCILRSVLHSSSRYICMPVFTFLWTMLDGVTSLINAFVVFQFSKVNEV